MPPNILWWGLGILTGVGQRGVQSYGPKILYRKIDLDCFHFYDLFSSRRLAFALCFCLWDLVLTLPVIQPRHYCIASAAEVHPQRLLLTVDVLKVPPPPPSSASVLRKFLLMLPLLLLPVCSRDLASADLCRSRRQWLHGFRARPA